MGWVVCDAQGCGQVATQARTVTKTIGGYDGTFMREVPVELCDTHAAEHDAQALARAVVEGRVPPPPSAGVASPSAPPDLGWSPPPTHAERTDAENLNHLAGRVIQALDGCGYCRMHRCTATAHRDLKAALFAATGIEYVPYAERLHAARQG